MTGTKKISKQESRKKRVVKPYRARQGMMGEKEGDVGKDGCADP